MDGGSVPQKLQLPEGDRQHSTVPPHPFSFLTNPPTHTPHTTYYTIMLGAN